mmetsp:Transcript_23728/g.43000  ORF Transcript_23728/g.43000 Transcript_23728/m.43000 type:complete len:359 (-) Transcript_23728:83-1159(-)|eukprot:CAMPEP_0197634110 /NCGR_PEP_ID=MMETSP1338-20131121/10306_1 /TAXON_ID=43686 ORGANISM="Pelagodinium beii, Strain RCC1491" /NCGR_SAMPLE_ID=MMETSP1338 /ASSEMBLY_ACC=CAM_ASM_000754 /LENGTH=358 /DNA_ID=CAMNT_0043205915 /DNA_START=1 /DNA_END=1077 /DNA_ORIENTATION=+
MAGPIVVDALLNVAQDSSVDGKAVAARRSAVEALVPAAQRGDERALAVLASSLEDWHVAVKKAAIDGLAEVATKGDRRVVYARLFAVKALAPSARIGVSKAIGAVVACLKDEHLTVRSAALEELIRIAREGDSASGGQLTARLEAIKALASLASCRAWGQAEAVGVLSECLLDWHASVRAAAGSALQGLLGKDKGPSQDNLAAASAAIEAFAPLALSGDSKGMAVLSAALGCGGAEFESLRRQALGALVRVALGADSAQSSQLRAKVSATKALSKELLNSASPFSERDKEGIAAALSICLQDWHADVWRVALDALCKLAEDSVGKGSLGKLAVAAVTPKACQGEAKAVAVLSKLGAAR